MERGLHNGPGMSGCSINCLKGGHVLQCFFQAKGGLLSRADACGKVFYLELKLIDWWETLFGYLAFCGEQDYGFAFIGCEWLRNGDHALLADDLRSLAHW